jgi:hypothetical protein
MGNDILDSIVNNGFPPMQPGLVCHVEIDVAKGRTMQEVAAVVAGILRNIASKIEAVELEDGFHPVAFGDGDNVGEVYLDFYEMSEF